MATPVQSQEKGGVNYRHDQVATPSDEERNVPGLVPASERILDAPRCSISLSAPTSLSLSKPFTYNIAITLDSSSPNPVVLKTEYMRELMTDKYALFHVEKSGHLEEFTREEENFLSYFKTPPEKEDITTDNGFFELAPGASRKETVRFEPPAWVEELRVGEEYLYVYKGGEVTWWDWGTIKVRHDGSQPLDNYWGQSL